MAKKKSSQIEKILKKTKHPFLLLLFVILFAGFGVGGYFVGNHLIKDDKFEIVGEKTINLVLGGEKYTDEGAIAISFGKDISEKIEVESNIDYTTEGQYYIRYKVDDIRYKGVYRYRTIIISEVGNE